MGNTTKNLGVAGVGLAFGVLFIAAIFFLPWLLMLTLGALHSFIPAIPALGFWPCFLIVVLLNIVGAIIRGGRS